MLTRLTGLTRRQKRIILLVTDAAAIFPALWLGFGLRGLPEGFFVLDWLAYAALLGLAVSLAEVMGISRTRIGAYEERAIASSLLLSALLSTGFAAIGIAQGMGGALPLAVLFLASHFAITVGARMLMARILASVHARGQERRPVVIYGAGRFGIQALQLLKSHPRFRPVAFIDDTPSLDGMTIGGLVVHAPSRLPQIIHRFDPTDVVLARPDLGPTDRAELVTRLERAGLRLAKMPDIAELAGQNGTASDPFAAISRPLPPHSRAVSQTYRDRVIMVTGAGGSIGSELARQLIKDRPACLILVDMSEYALYRIEAELRRPAAAAGVELVPVLGSVADAQTMRRCLAHYSVEIVLHAAAYKHVPLVEANRGAALANNVLGTECLARLASDSGVARFVLISSDKAVRPASTMGLTKWMTEQIVKDLGRRVPGFHTATVRFGNVLGSSGSVLPLFQQQVRAGGPVTITDARMERYFMSVEEAVHLVLEAGAMAEQNATYLFDMGNPVRIEALARRVIQAAGYAVRDENCPDGDIPLSFIGARPGEKLREELTSAGRTLPSTHPRIFRVEEPILSQFEIAQILRRTRQAIDDGSDLDLSGLDHAWSPESTEATG